MTHCDVALIVSRFTVNRFIYDDVLADSGIYGDDMLHLSFPMPVCSNSSLRNNMLIPEYVG